MSGNVFGVFWFELLLGRERPENGEENTLVPQVYRR